MVDYLGTGGGGDYGVSNSSPKNEEAKTIDGGEAAPATSSYEYKMPGQEPANQASSKQSSAPGANKAGASPDNLWNSIL